MGLMELTSCAALSNAPFPPQHGPVFDSAARAMRKAFESPKIATVNFTIDAKILDSNEKLFDPLRLVGFASKIDSRLVFTKEGLAHSTDCSFFDRPNCRMFAVATMSYDRAYRLRYGHDEGRIDAIEMSGFVKSTPIGALGRAIARSRAASCITPAQKTVPWLGKATNGLSQVRMTFAGDLVRFEDADFVHALEGQKPAIFATCPVDPRELENEIPDLGPTTPP